MENALSNLATSSLLPCNMEVSVIDQPSIQSTTVMAIEQAEQSWMVPITEYLANGALPKICAEAIKLKAQATRYPLLNGALYRHSFLGSSLRCLPLREVILVKEQVHQGV